MDKNLHLRMEQKLYMSPYLQQMFEILQLPILALEQRINQELESNPLLETEEDEPGAGTEDEDFNEAENIKYDELIRVFEDSSDMGSYNYTRNEEGKTGLIEGLLVKPESLQEHLLWQLRLNIPDDKEFDIGERIITNIDTRGYLVCSLEDIAANTDATIEDVEKVLKVVQTFEPFGVSCRDLRECLLIQIRFSGEKDLYAEAILEHHFDLLFRHKYKELAHKLGISENTLNRTIKYIQHFDPNPGYQYDTKITQYVVPDVIVNQTPNSEFLIVINDEWIPRLRINKRYRGLLTNKNVDNKIKKYLKEKIRNAMLFIKSIEQRNTTLYKIAEAIVRYQKAFLLKGNEHLSPLTLRDIADSIGFHESTVSRVTSDKYIQTPLGIYEMKYFFSKKIRTDNEQGIASKSVMEIIKDLIQKESHPLSDAEINDFLDKQGIRISRRTISKYRKQLKILPSYLRK
ncbi:MAG: RNA polymerase factor sigma-54 [bacterium]|nr:RNA polymerase factor sigma-54 [bacterium]